MSPSLPAPSPLRRDNLDMLRGLAALLVCLFHFTGSGFLPDGTGTRILAHGYLGFDVFFVISGFVIPLALHRAGYGVGDYGIFIRRRIFRLFPAYLVSGLLVLTLWYASSLHPAFRGSRPHLTLVQGLGNLTLTADLLHTPWINPVYWTLAIELQYYLLIGLVFPWLVSAQRGSRYAAMALWLLAPCLGPLPATVWTYAALFGMGVYTFMRVNRLITMRECAGLLVAAAVVHGMQSDWLSSGAGLVAALAILLLPAIKARLLLFLGTISYSLYLIHVPFGGKLINLAQRLPDNPALRLMLLLLATVTTIMAAWVFYLLIERPFHEFSRSARFVRPRKTE